MDAPSLVGAHGQAGWTACCSRGCYSPWLLLFPIISVLSDLGGPADRAAPPSPHAEPAAIGAGPMQVCARSAKRIPRGRARAGGR